MTLNNEFDNGKKKEILDDNKEPFLSIENSNKQDTSQENEEDNCIEEGLKGTLLNPFEEDVEFQFELVLNNENENTLSNPFAILGQGRYSKVLLARVVTPGKQVLRHLAIKIQADYYTFPKQNPKPMEKNSSIDSLWEQEYDSLLTLEKENKVIKPEERGVEFVSIFEIFKRREQKEKIQKPKKFPPVVFCKQQKCFFHIFCPECHEILHTCTDSQRLAEIGKWDQVAFRFLYCKNCSNELYLKYQDYKTNFLNNPKIKSERELYLSYKNSLKKEELPPKSFPCRICKHKEECYDGGKVVNRLYPFSFYDYYAIPMELLHLPLKDFCKLLGRYQWQQLKEKSDKKSYGYMKVLEQIEPNFISSEQLIYQLDRTGKEALEIFMLKLTLFAQIIRGVWKIHKLLKKPHLDIKPENICIEIPPLNLDRPALEEFRTKILDLASTMQRDVRTKNIPGSENIWMQPCNVSNSFTSDHLRNGEFGENLYNLQIKILEVNDDKTIAKFSVAGADWKPDKYTENDRFQLNLGEYVEGEIWCKTDGTCLNTVKIDIHEGKENFVPDEFFNNISITVYQSFSIPEDIYALGKILLYILFYNSKYEKPDEFGKLKRIFDECIVEIERKPTEKINSLLRKKFQENMSDLGKHNIFWDQSTKNNNAITEMLWEDTLVLIVKMITNIPKFSICANHSDVGKHPHTKIEVVKKELEGIIAKIKLELFDGLKTNKVIEKYLQSVSESKNAPEEERENCLQEKIKVITKILEEMKDRSKEEVIATLNKKVVELTPYEKEEIRKQFPLVSDQRDIEIEKFKKELGEKTGSPFVEKILSAFQVSNTLSEKHKLEPQAFAKAFDVFLKNMRKMQDLTEEWKKLIDAESNLKIIIDEKFSEELDNRKDMSKDLFKELSKIGINPNDVIFVGKSPQWDIKSGNHKYCAKKRNESIYIYKLEHHLENPEGTLAKSRSRATPHASVAPILTRDLGQLFFLASSDNKLKEFTQTINDIIATLEINKRLYDTLNDFFQECSPDVIEKTVMFGRRWAAYQELFKVHQKEFRKLLNDRK